MTTLATATTEITIEAILGGQYPILDADGKRIGTVQLRNGFAEFYGAAGTAYAGFTFTVREGLRGVQEAFRGGVRNGFDGRHEAYAPLPTAPADNIETGDEVIAVEVRYVGKDWTRVEREYTGIVKWVGEKGISMAVPFKDGTGSYEVCVLRSAASLLSKANPCQCEHVDHYPLAGTTPVKHPIAHATAGEQAAWWFGKVCDDCAATCQAGNLIR